MRSTVAQFLRRWRSSSSQIPTLAVKKITGSLVGKATLCGLGGYVLGGLTWSSITEDDLKTEQNVIWLHHDVDRRQRMVEKLEKKCKERLRTTKDA